MSDPSREASLADEYAAVCARACIPDAVNSTLCDPDDDACQCRPESTQAIEVKARECLQNHCGAALSKSCPPPGRPVLPALSDSSILGSFPPSLSSLDLARRVSALLTRSAPSSRPIDVVIFAARARHCSAVANGQAPSSSSLLAPSASPTASGAATPSASPDADVSARPSAQDPPGSGDAPAASTSVYLALTIAFGTVIGLAVLCSGYLGYVSLRRRRRRRRSRGRQLSMDDLGCVGASDKGGHEGDQAAASVASNGLDDAGWSPLRPDTASPPSLPEYPGADAEPTEARRQHRPHEVDGLGMYAVVECVPRGVVAMLPTRRLTLQGRQLRY